MTRKDKLPDADGYAVNVSTGTVHVRHPGEHAGTVQRTRTEHGVSTLLGGSRLKVCRTCWPEDVLPKDAAPTASAVQQRRVESGQ